MFTLSSEYIHLYWSGRPLHVCEFLWIISTHSFLEHLHAYMWIMLNLHAWQYIIHAIDLCLTIVILYLLHA